MNSENNHNHSEDTERMHSQRIDKIAVQGHVARASQSAAGAMFETQVLERAQRKMLFLRHGQDQQHQDDHPCDQFHVAV